MEVGSVVIGGLTGSASGICTDSYVVYIQTGIEMVILLDHLTVFVV